MKTGSSSRRRFLGRVAIPGLGYLIFPMLRRAKATCPAPSPPSWAVLTDYARHCPSVHNLQPHRLKPVSETEADLYYEPTRLLPVGDPGSVFATVALGIFCEHLSMAAAHDGWSVRIEQVVAPVNENQPVLTRFAQLRLVPENDPKSPDRELMLKRKTSRLPYNGKVLDQALLTNLEEEARKAGHELFHSNDPALVEEIIALNQQTLFHDINVDADRKELDHLFRYTEKEAREHLDGLWAECMGFPGSLMRSVFQHPEKWRKGIRKKLLSGKYKRSFKGTATICWFGGKFDETTDWLTAGRMLARSWLLLTRGNAFIQPFGSLITNASAYAQVQKKFTQPAEGKKIWMIFRAGYSKEPARSFRLPLEQVLMHE